jgi:ribonuclease BN (tRNA processing enzyme)
MTIQFIGTGGAFDYRQGNSAAIVAWRDMRILVDCGADVFRALRERDAADDITHILITHLHDDHAGSLGSLLAYHTIVLRKPRLKLIYPTESFRKHLHAFLDFIIRTDEHAEFVAIDDIPGLSFIDTFGRHVPQFPTFAYIFTEGERTIAYSGDIGDPDFVFDNLRSLRLHGATVFHDISFSPQNKAHAFYKDVAKHAGEFEIYGYHLDPEKAPDDNPIRLVPVEMRV